MYVGMSLSVESGNIWNGGSNPFNVWTSPFDPKYDRLFVGSFRNFGDFTAATPGPTVTISATGGNLSITFTGSKLQQSATVNGTFTDIAGATSPYPVPKNTPAMFFRAVQ
jgi:hypothetical protein